MRRHLTYLQLACCLAALAQQPAALAGSATSVPPEARDTSNGAISAAQNVVYEQEAANYLAEARHYAQTAAAQEAEYEQQLLAAEKTLQQQLLDVEKAEAEARNLAEQAQAAAVLADALNQKAHAAIAAAEAAYRQADTIEAALQAEEAALPQTRTEAASAPAVPAETVKHPSLEDTDELLRLEKEMRALEKQQKDAELARRNNIPMIEVQEAPTVDWSVADAAHARADRLNQIAMEADRAAEQAERMAGEKTVLADEAAYRAAEARQAVLDAQLVASDMKEALQQAHLYAKQTKADLEQLIYSLDNPPGSHFFFTSTNFYRWSGDFNTRGWQMAQPMYYGYWQRDFSYGLYTRYIISRNNSVGANGRVNTLSDTSLYLNKRNDKPKYLTEYSLNVNMPTGKATLSQSERYAMMNEDLVEVSQFGKGWQFAPGIAVSRKIGKEDLWTLGTSYTFSNSYDPTSQIPNDTVSPGGEWRKFLRWRHAGQDWQFIGELVNTTSSRTTLSDGSWYDTGTEWEYKLTYNRKLSEQQNLMLYYWRENQDINPILPSDATNALAHYVGAMWSKKLDEQHVFRVTFDVMKTNGSRYAGIYNDFVDHTNPRYTVVDGRTKYTAGLGYDIKINAQSNLSLDLQLFRMKDGKSDYNHPEMTYRGVNLLAKYNRSL